MGPLEKHKFGLILLIHAVYIHTSKKFRIISSWQLNGWSSDFQEILQRFIDEQIKITSPDLKAYNIAKCLLSFTKEFFYLRYEKTNLKAYTNSKNGRFVWVFRISCDRRWENM